MVDNQNSDLALNFKESGDMARDKGLFDLAIENYKRALSIRPGYWQAHANLSMVLANNECYQDAIDHAQHAASIMPSIAELFDNLGAIQRLSDDYKGSIISHKRAITLNPELVSAYNNLGLSYEKLQDTEGAIRSFNGSLSVDSDQPVIFLHLADLYFLKKNYAESLEFYRQSVSLDSYEVYLKLGTAYHHTGDYQKAISAFKSAIQKRPDSSEAYLNLGVSCTAGNMVEEAISSYQKAVDYDSLCDSGYIYLSDLLRKNGDQSSSIAAAQSALNICKSVDGYIVLGNAMNDDNNISGSVNAFDMALKMGPDNIRVASMLYHLKQKLCDWDGLSILNKRIKALIESGGGQDLGEPFAAIARTDDLWQNLKIATYRSGQIEKRSKSTGTRFDHANHSRNKEKIRIGYLSCDIYDHATAHLMLGVFREHNKRKYEIYTYSYGKVDDSHYRQDIIDNSDQFHDVERLSDLEISNLIYSDQVDILIDLKGYTRDSRLGICALRPAPVQATYLGFPGTSGARFFDYVLTDRIVTPMEHADCYSEKFVILPDSYQCTDNQQVISKRAFNRSTLGLPERGMVFCSFNRSYKLEPIFFDVWMRLLGALNDSVLWLYETNRETIHNIRSEATLRGISSDRIVFADKMGKADHLKRMQLADLILDTRIYNGHTTTSDALWAGVPVVTMEGQHFASRVSSSLLHALDVPELVTKTIDEYESLALELSQAPEKLHSIRDRIRTNRSHSPLFNTTRFTLNLEKGYFSMWKRYGENKKPDHITI